MAKDSPELLGILRSLSSFEVYNLRLKLWESHSTNVAIIESVFHGEIRLYRSSTLTDSSTLR